MRTISQVFADMVFNNEDSKAQGYLRQYGLEQTSALKVLALKGSISPVWMDIFRTTVHTATPTDIGDALLLALAVPTQWDRRNVFVEWLAQNLDGEWHKKFNPIHHAAFHGVPEAFSALEAVYSSKTGEAFNWNALNNSGHPPFYLALSEGHLETVVQIVKKGGKSTLMIPNPKSPGKQISVLNLVFQNKAGVLSYIKEVWDSAREKAAIQKSLEHSIENEEGEETSGKRKKNRKM